MDGISDSGIIEHSSLRISIELRVSQSDDKTGALVEKLVLGYRRDAVVRILVLHWHQSSLVRTILHKKIDKEIKMVCADWVTKHFKHIERSVESNSGRNCFNFTKENANLLIE